jgi:hypothetical protein
MRRTKKWCAETLHQSEAQQQLRDSSADITAMAAAKTKNKESRPLPPTVSVNGKENRDSFNSPIWPNNQAQKRGYLSIRPFAIPVVVFP